MFRTANIPSVYASTTKPKMAEGGRTMAPSAIVSTYKVDGDGTPGVLLENGLTWNNGIGLNWDNGIAISL